MSLPRVFILTGPDVGLEREVADGAVFGRGDDCAVHLRDPSVSRHHARVEKSAEGYAVVDLGSRNGIAKDGTRAERIALKHGLEFTLGSVLIRFVDAAPIEVEEIEIEPAPGGADDDDPTLTSVKDAPAARAPGAPAPQIGVARRRAIASREGVMQFHKIEGGPPSLLRDDLGQQSPVVRGLLVLGAIALAAGLFYASWKLATTVTPEGGKPAATAEEPAEPTTGR